MLGADTVASQVSERKLRRRRMLPLLAGIPFLAAPVDLALENWVTGSTGRKAACYTPLPGYQTLLAGLVPALFVALALGCTVAGIVTLVSGRRHRLRAARDAGRTTLALSLPSLVTSVTFGFVAWVAVGFSTWCF